MHIKYIHTFYIYTKKIYIYIYMRMKNLAECSYYSFSSRKNSSFIISHYTATKTCIDESGDD